MKTPPPNRRIQISIPPGSQSAPSSSRGRNHDDDSSSDEEEHEFDFDAAGESPPATTIGNSPSASSSKSLPTSPTDDVNNVDPTMLDFPINVECT